MWCFDEKIDTKINGTQSSEMDQYKHRHLIFNESIIHREIVVVFTIHVTHAKKKKSKPQPKLHTTHKHSK